MEIDLHDKNVNEAINYFMIKYNEIISKGFKGEINVIHGYGSSGVLKEKKTMHCGEFIILALFV
jgi:dsDNA-specific endonuclease/ATPase MutS2